MEGPSEHGLREPTGCMPLKRPSPHRLTSGAYYYPSQRRLLKPRDSKGAQGHSACGAAGIQTLAVFDQAACGASVTEWHNHWIEVRH